MVPTVKNGYLHAYEYPYGLCLKTPAWRAWLRRNKRFWVETKAGVLIPCYKIDHYWRMEKSGTSVRARVHLGKTNKLADAGPRYLHLKAKAAAEKFEELKASEASSPH